MYKFFRLITISNSTADIKSLHRASFHGFGNRAEHPGGWVACYLGQSDVPILKVDRDGRRVPDVFDPDGSLVVSGRTKEALSGLPHIEFKDVQFRKLADFYYPKGDLSIFNEHPHVDEKELLQKAPDNPKFHALIGRHFELVIARYRDVSKNFIDGIPVRLRQGRTIRDENPEYVASKAMLAEYPIHWPTQVGIIFSEPAFIAIKPFLDADYFESQEYVVPE